MKLQNKASIIMTFFGLVILLLLSGGYDMYSQRVFQAKELQRMLNVSQEVALHVGSCLTEKARIASTLSSSPLIKDALLKSNAEFAAFSDVQRIQEVDRLNQQWKSTADINNPFIQDHMANPVAEYLKQQRIVIPGEYGEIFLTNRYGVMIATTGKLTTLAHAHKYWWVAGFNDGKGRIFLDDRGFDTSVGGYVLGVVIPIMNNNEIIGILKSNVNVMGPLTGAIQTFNQRNVGKSRIVRTGGLIVAEQGIKPLSASVNEACKDQLRKKEDCTSIFADSSDDRFVAFSPIQITMGSEKFGFGGSKESIDHIKGNLGEGWHVVVSVNEEEANETVNRTTALIIIVGIFVTILSAFVSLLLGKWVANPIVKLAGTAQVIGEGRLDTRAEVLSGDEIGSLAQSFNNMAENLQNTMASRDELIFEIKQRKKAEGEKEEIIVALEKAIEEINTLEGILPICMHCKEIRDDKGYWNQLEKYISEHSQVQFSHSICDKCLKEHYPEFNRKKSRIVPNRPDSADFK